MELRFHSPEAEGKFRRRNNYSNSNIRGPQRARETAHAGFLTVRHLEDGSLERVYLHEGSKSAAAAQYVDHDELE
jgi:hypothetical protein